MTEQLNAKYAIEGIVGRGGMGEVFAGRAIGVEGFSRPVAIKRIHPQYSDDRALRLMLAAEARLTARLSHSNIVAVHDLDEDGAGRLFLVMELVNGIDLASLLRTGALPVPTALFVTCEILRGLGHAHDLPATDDSLRGLVHRDVSPQNVLIGWDGAVKVSDFGLAKARVTGNASASLFIKGKLAYMSPEHANGDALDGRSDLFSVGAMLWEMLCGARLFGRDTMEATVRSVLFDPLPSPRSRASDLPRGIERITMRLLERDRSRRYESAGAALAALLACAAYPKDGREQVSALLRERLSARQLSAARVRMLGPAPALPFLDEETTLAPPVAPLPVPREPYPDAPRPSRAPRAVVLGLLVVATTLAAIFALQSLHAGGDAAPAAPAAREVTPIEPPADRQQPGETRAFGATAPLPSSPIPAAAAAAPPAPPMKASAGRPPEDGRPAPPAPKAEPTRRDGIRVLDLRDLAAKPEERRPLR